MNSAIPSSSTLWAQASKEWVIPAKPKPGRKPKKELSATPKDETIESDAKGRRVQNRAAQRAFRERKQSQLADLQARVQLYEQGEVERNVALQNIAKRLKEENEALRRENLSLREELRRFRPERFPDTDRKRWRGSTTPSNIADTNARKRIKTDDPSPLSPSSAPTSAISLIHSPSSLGSSPDSVDSSTSSVPNDPYSPTSFSSRSPTTMYPPSTQEQMTSLFSNIPGKVLGCVSENRGQPSFDQAFDILDCGFCSDDTPCVCRELALQQVAARIAIAGGVPGSSPSIPHNPTSAAPVGSLSPPEVKMESHGSISIDSTPQLSPAIVPATCITSITTPSILDNLPAYSPPIPLPRRRQSEPSSNNNLFPIFPVQSTDPRLARNTADCSGDPSNCLACADDPFGKAFCAALGSFIKECTRCPKNCSLSSKCSNSPSVRDMTEPSCSQGPATSASSSQSPSSTERIPCNAAWAQLKSHPNIAFADLTLLAEVVARRSKCTGPRIRSPVSGLPSSTRQGTQGRPTVEQGTDDIPILLTDPHAQHQGRRNINLQTNSSGKQTLECGRQRVVDVEAEGVSDALALLSSQFRRR